MSRRLFHGQLADEIAGEDRLRAERLRLLARSLVDILRDALVRDGMVRIHGFGTFRLKRMAPRRGINPQTGEPIEIPARNRVLFRPAKALRDRIEPDHPAAVPLAEPHESREAWLGGRMGDSPVAGGLPPGDHERSHRSYFPDRVAAASMVAPTARVTASAYPEANRDSASREANLGGAMADSPSAGRVITADHADSAAGQSGTGAANDDSAPIEPHPESTGDRPVPPPGGTVRYEPREPPGQGTVDDDGGTGRPGETDSPTPTEPPQPPETTGTATASGADSELASESGRDERGPAGRWLALVALLLLAVLLAWWLWPRTEPTPLATGTPGVTTEGAGEAGAQQDEEPAAADATGDAPDEPAASETATGEPADSSGEGAAASSVADATGDGGEAGETAAAQAEASAAGEADGADTPSAQLEPEQAGTGQDASAPAEPEPAASGGIESAESEPAASDGIESAEPESAASGGIASAEPEPAASDEIESAAATGASAGEAQAAPEGDADAQAGTGAQSGTDSAVAQAEASATDAGGVEASSADTATPWFSARDYSVKAGDTLWGLSDRNYVNPYYWPHIWNHNRSLSNPDRIEIDQQLWLPQLVGEPRSLTAADRRSIAEGYLRLYRFWKDTGAANPQYALVGVRYFDASVMPPELRNDPSAGRPGDAMAAAFEALLMAEFPAQQ